MKDIVDICRECLGIGNCIVLATVLVSPLQCNQFVDMWAYWDVQTGALGIGTGWIVGDNSLMYYQDPSFTQPLFGAISTLTVTEGLWAFPRGK